MHGIQKHRDLPVTSICLAVAAVLLGIALYISGGFYTTRALQLVTLAYVFCVLGVVLRHVPLADGRPRARAARLRQRRGP